MLSPHHLEKSSWLANLAENQTFLAGATLALLAGIFATGLWPFNFFAGNRAYWDASARSLRFRPYGIAYSTSDVVPHQAASGSSREAATIELRFRIAPRRTRHYSVIAAIGKDASRPVLAIVQSGTYLGVYVSCSECAGGLRKMWVDDLLRQPVDRLVTVVVGEAGTDVFVDGAHALHRPPSFVAAGRFRGPLVLGNSADGGFPWSGEVFGVAIYSRALTASEEAERFRDWSSGARERLAAAPGIVALYVFDAPPQGTLIRDRIGSQPDISIPGRFHPVHRVLFRRYSAADLDWPDIFINVVGFIPLGAVLFAYFQAPPATWRHSAWLAFLVSVGASILIEALQLYLPSRDSSLIDVASNTIGAALGVLCAYAVIRTWRVASPRA